MKKNRFILLFILFLPLASALEFNDDNSLPHGFSSGLQKNPTLTGSAIKCFPEYVCGDWSECEDGIKNRVCEDRKCGRRSITERDFCDIELQGCTPKIKCTEWSQCVYTDKVENLLAGKISFGGYKDRLCVDENRCSDSFIEEGICEESYDLQLSETEVCGEKFLVASDSLSNKEVAKINLESWKNKKLDIVFTQGETAYCPSCFNGAKDPNEDEIDCGGDCKACKKNRTFPIFLIVSSLWILSLVFATLSVKEFKIAHAMLKSGHINNIERSISRGLGR